MRKVADTSREAYDDLKPNITKRQKEVLVAFENLLAIHYSVTDLQVANFLMWPINRITGRIGELLDSGKLEIVKKAVPKESNTRVRYCAFKRHGQQEMF